MLLQAGEPRSFAELENELLKGQKLQGVLTSDEVQVGRCWSVCVTGREGPQDTQAPDGQQPDMHAEKTAPVMPTASALLCHSALLAQAVGARTHRKDTPARAVPHRLTLVLAVHGCLALFAGDPARSWLGAGLPAVHNGQPHCQRHLPAE